MELIGVQGRNYGLVVTDLCGKIVPDQSFVKVFSIVDMIYHINVTYMYMCIVG